ncbi:MAG: tripartite tricarboxylate transporter substrate binding protein [Planctomycetota bacterium]
MKPFNVLLAAALAACALTAPAFAEDYPSKPIKVVVPWPAGGLVDIVARVVGQKLQAALGQPIVVESKLGAGGVIGADAVAKAVPDGHTILLTTNALTMNEALRPGKLPFDIYASFIPIVVAGRAPSVVVVHSASGIQTLQDLIARAKAKPGGVTYGSAGNGTAAHLSAELFKTMLGLNIIHVPYRGAPLAMTDQIAGRIDFHFANAAVALPQIRAGKVRPLAITSAERSDMFQNVPTMAEAGVPNFEADQWVGYLAPAATPRSVVERLAVEANKALALADVRSALLRSGIIADGRSTPGSFAEYLKQDHSRWVEVVKAANIKAE